MKLKDSELKNILAEVEAEIGALLKSEGDALKKAAPPSPEADDESAGPADASASAPAGDEGSDPSAGGPPEDSASASAPAADESAPASAEAPAPAASPDASAAPMDPAADPAAAGPVDPAMLQAEYAKLAPEELMAHYKAAKAAVFAIMGAGGDAGSPAPDASAAPAPAPAASPSPAPAASPSPAGPPPALKAEVPATMKKNPANGGSEKAAVPDAIKSEPAPEGAPLAKAETDSMADLQEQVNLMAKALDLVIGTPIRKAVTSVSFVPKTDETPAEPTKAEVETKLTEKLRAGKLSKSDKDRVISYSLGNIKFEQIKDLLK